MSEFDESADQGPAAPNAGEVSVSELSQALKRTVEDRFGYVRVRGEISGFRGVHSSGHAYLAPGGKQMLLEGRGPGARLRIIDGNDKVNYKPCVDITFASAAKTYGDKVLAIVLTGMGADGRDGARLLKEQGATIWAQDEASCVVYGMPQAVAKAGIASESLPLDRVAQRILVELGR